MMRPGYAECDTAPILQDKKSLHFACWDAAQDCAERCRHHAAGACSSCLFLHASITAQHAQQARAF